MLNDYRSKVGIYRIAAFTSNNLCIEELYHNVHDKNIRRVRIDIESNIANLFDSSTYLYLKNNIPKKPIPTLKDIAIFLIPWIVVYIITAIIVYLGWYRDKKSLVKKRPSETNIEAQQDLESSLYDDFNPEIIDEVEEIPVEDEDDTMPETQESENKKNDV